MENSTCLRGVPVCKVKLHQNLNAFFTEFILLIQIYWRDNPRFPSLSPIPCPEILILCLLTCFEAL